MEESERRSIESLGDLQPEIGSATGRSEGVQPERLPFKSAGSEHVDIAKFRATSPPTILLTTYEALQGVDNDYSDKEKRLRQGVVPLVDTFDGIELAKLQNEDADKY